MTVCRSGCFVISASHVISTQHQRLLWAPPPRPLQYFEDRQRESVTRETKVSVLRRHILNSQDGSWKRKKDPANKHPLFLLQQDRVCCCALGSDVIVMGHPLRDLWGCDSQITSSGGARQLQHWFLFHWLAHANTTPLLPPRPIAQTQTCMYSSNNTKIEYSEFTVLSVRSFSQREAAVERLTLENSIYLSEYHH